MSMIANSTTMLMNQIISIEISKKKSNTLESKQNKTSVINSIFVYLRGNYFFNLSRRNALAALFLHI